MALKLEQKKEIVADVTEQVKGSVSIVAVDYRGLTSPEMTDLRAKANQCGVKLRIIRNTLAKRALEGTDYTGLTEALTGPVMLAFSPEEPGASARVIRDFMKTSEHLEVKAISLGSDLLGKEKLDAVADLPNKEEAIAKLMSVMQAPIIKFLQTLSAPQLKLVRTLMAVRDNKQAS